MAFLAKISSPTLAWEGSKLGTDRVSRSLILPEQQTHHYDHFTKILEYDYNLAKWDQGGT